MIASKVEAYLRRQISLSDLVDWAESQMMDGEFDSPESRDAAARLGLADVREFGLTWDECQQLLKSLGFSAKISIVTA
ncbi:MAG: hypothetical protein ABSH08_01805 [Tepidisphaeraceae bacterium]